MIDEHCNSKANKQTGLMYLQLLTSNKIITAFVILDSTKSRVVFLYNIFERLSQKFGKGSDIDYDLNLFFDDQTLIKK